MFSLRSNIRLICTRKSKVRLYSQPALYSEQEYTDEPQYPPILDLSRRATNRRKREEMYNKLKILNTVEEKQIGLNMPYYYGWRCIMLNEHKIPYNALSFVKYYTRTHFQPVDKLPEFYNDTDDLATTIMNEIKGLIEDAIVFELEAVKRPKITIEADLPEQQQKTDAVARCVVRQIHRIICNSLSDKIPHILSSQTDYDPRVEAFWFLGKGDQDDLSEEEKKNTITFNHNIQYIGKPLITLRNHLPLKPLIPYSEAENPEFIVPKFKFQPIRVGYFNELRHGTNIPGFWPGDYDEFGLLSIHGRGHIDIRPKQFGDEDNIEALHCQALLSSFGWLLAQANYQGFTTYNDITYPLVTQNIITDGKIWSLYAYQLNTIVMHNEQCDENPKHNICFGMKPQALYDEIENGKVKGLNEDLLKMLIQLYLNSPEEREHAMKPYLGEEEQVVADLEDDQKRAWLESCFKQLMSNRPRHKLLPEIHLWERIYKIQFPTRYHLEPRRRPFELGINRYNRRLDEHLPPYIPKKLRTDKKKKWENTYYPDV